MTEGAADAPRWRRLGIIAGGGRLPALVAQAQNGGEEAPFVIRVKGFCDEGFEGFDTATFDITEIGRVFKRLREAGCDAVCFAGVVKRPDFASLKNLDTATALLLPQLAAAGRKGDDALLRVILNRFEEEGFTIVGADEALRDAVPAPGVLGGIQPGEAGIADARKALVTARASGALDIGQGAVVCDGLVLAVEAQEGTDAMLRRVAELPEALRGGERRRRGVLGKAPKPVQERRVDLPVIGAATVENAAAAGLAGIAVEAGGALVLDRARMLKLADAAGVFVIALAPDGE
ncbi:MAG: UDP-2,3-diacylglucosamine diphosphatase LpxI [Maricaulaceae bacterium]|nr:UDP-2,3-diacylglucosamine diphosphatase LpxI [Maricaulaceae bacterium]